MVCSGRTVPTEPQNLQRSGRRNRTIGGYHAGGSGKVFVLMRLCPGSTAVRGSALAEGPTSHASRIDLTVVATGVCPARRMFN
jgi:hypothetical protein